MKTRNLTPWNVIVYSGYAHWDKPIDELEDAFRTEREARDYAKSIEQYHPEYRVESFEED